MPDQNGLEYLRANSSKAQVILSTAYPQYALEAFELEVIDYLVKPIRLERFFKAVHRAKALFELQLKEQLQITQLDQEFCYIKSERRIVKIFLKDIRYF